MRLWVIENKPKGGKWACWVTFTVKKDAKWSLQHSRRIYDSTYEFRLVEYAPVRKAKK